MLSGCLQKVWASTGFLHIFSPCGWSFTSGQPENTKFILQTPQNFHTTSLPEVWWWLSLTMMMSTYKGLGKLVKRSRDHSGKKNEPKSNFLVQISSGGVGVFSVKGWGPRSSICPSKPRETKHLGGISWDFAGISQVRPKSLRKKSGKKKARKHRLFGLVGLGTTPGLSQGQTQLVPGTNPGCPWDKPRFSPYFTQWKPSIGLSQGQPGVEGQHKRFMC